MTNRTYVRIIKADGIATIDIVVGEIQGMEIHISVRGLVEFILRSGDIDNRKRSVAENAMLEGGRIHRMIQRAMGKEYRSEVSLSHRVEMNDYVIWIDGRADGIIEGERITIDEIKGTYKKLDLISEPVPIHLAQAKCYAYFYAFENHLNDIEIRMTYCNLETEEIRYFYQLYTINELSEWFDSIIKKYKKWTDFHFEWAEKRQNSIKKLEFPFSYRNGQKELASHVYRTIVHKKKLFLEAPTGVGKTLSTVFPAVKAIGEAKADKMFYLTAKTITATVAEDSFSLLRKKGLLFKTVIITAKEKICFLEKCNCNPLECPYAKGHYDRINEAMYHLLISEDHFSREVILDYAEKYQLCPFEFCLDLSLFSDGIICDYNYLFDPHVYLKRFFAESKSKNYIFLIDEAHNLVDRGRDMYSATLVKEDFLALKKSVKVYDKRLAKKIESCNHLFLLWKRECESYRIYHDISNFLLKLDILYSALSDYLENHDDSPVRDEVLEFYFKVAHFQLMSSNVNEGYVIYSAYDESGNFFIRLFNVDPSSNLKECMDRGISSVLFSATLLPIQYYKGLLGGEPTDYEVYAESTFCKEQRILLVGKDVTSKYTMRTESQYKKIAHYLYKIVKTKIGKYMVFLPSYAFLRSVYWEFQKIEGAVEIVECLLQKEGMKECEREQFINAFTSSGMEKNGNTMVKEADRKKCKSLLGFCVLGGVFSEGIDFKKDSLIGAVIVGTGIPQICLERELIKEYFDRGDAKGYAYAYLYPGMNKVLQAAGRVIRTHEDRGSITLLDERFLKPAYQSLFPREWEEYQVTSLAEIEIKLNNFWCTKK